ncbi:hypothetical protein OPV22_017303 [Ensete ventricosum]|uniref:Uncharacterized protein n=1 Tax=Ensete ventricosum TaxID=4639 RepID=A0AAV8R1V9_ENSVE|nr:hypothetical protein OPV22_017303 [Ensete ventricosum]
MVGGHQSSHSHCFGLDSFLDYQIAIAAEEGTSLRIREEEEQRHAVARNKNSPCCFASSKAAAGYPKKSSVVGSRPSLEGLFLRLARLFRRRSMESRVIAGIKRRQRERATKRALRGHLAAAARDMGPCDAARERRNRMWTDSITYN